jgi:hypothetical protein
VEIPSQNKFKIMKIAQKITVVITLITLFASCQPGSDTKEILKKPETRKELMDKIANDSTLSKEMMAAMMSSHSGMAMMQNHESMMKMMKDNPGMMENMMADMMETCKNDSTMMSGMCKEMMGNPQMMDMMEKMKGKNMDMGKMNGMDTTKAIDHKSHH